MLLLLRLHYHTPQRHELAGKGRRHEGAGVERLGLLQLVRRNCSQRWCNIKCSCTHTPTARCGRCTSRAFDASVTCLHQTFPNGHWDLLRDINWAHVKRMLWLYLTVCYPGISIKVMRAFVCQDIDGTMYLKVLSAAA